MLFILHFSYQIIFKFSFSKLLCHWLILFSSLKHSCSWTLFKESMSKMMLNQLHKHLEQGLSTCNPLMCVVLPPYIFTCICSFTKRNNSQPKGFKETNTTNVCTEICLQYLQWKRVLPFTNEILFMPMFTSFPTLLNFSEQRSLAESVLIFSVVCCTLYFWTLSPSQK